MRIIQINKDLELEVDSFCTNLFTKTRQKDFQHPKTKLKELYDDLRPNKHKDYRAYIQKIMTEYDDILKADPDKMKLYISEFTKILPIAWLKNDLPYKKIRFYESVIEAMRYKDLREKEFPDYLKDKHIKSCVYCNSQLSVVVDNCYWDKKRKKKVKYRKANFELDHFYPKSDYPFLCTSFYNLYPVCGNCNRAKSANSVKFTLYTRGNELDIFNFWIDDSSIVDYWTSRKHTDLKIWFEHKQGDIDFLENHSETFSIQGIYNTQTDLAEELVHKAKAYSNAYQKGLVDTFNDLFPDKALIKRLLIGNYEKPEDIHKRPMAKFTQDIARQLRLI